MEIGPSDWKRSKSVKTCASTGMRKLAFSYCGQECLHRDTWQYQSKCRQPLDSAIPFLGIYLTDILIYVPKI